LNDIGDFIARDNPERAATFVQELESACHRIASNPEAHVVRNDLQRGMRMALHKHYLILFRITPEEIRIERVLHGARNVKRILRD
jgi:toxin ParE1/3/4